MCLAKGPQRSDAGEGGTRGLSVSIQALYHWATALPLTLCNGGCNNVEYMYGNVTFFLTNRNFEIIQMACDEKYHAFALLYS